MKRLFTRGVHLESHDSDSGHDIDDFRLGTLLRRTVCAWDLKSEKTRDILENTEQRLGPTFAIYLFIYSQVNFVKDGCGSDLKCQSNLQLQYKFCSREPNQDIFNPLPM